MSWHLYILKCADETLYTGITTDVERRLKEHNESARGARYTRARRPVTLVKSFVCTSRSEAARLEYRFKALERSEKLRRLRSGQVQDLLTEADGG